MSLFHVNNDSDRNTRLDKRLKDREDEYITYKQIHILVGTFNVNNRPAPNDVQLGEWLHRQTQSNEQNPFILPDIIAVGFQEIDTSSGAYIYDDKKKEDEWDQVVRRTIQTSYRIKDEQMKFQSLSRIRLMGILLFVYVRGMHMSKCSSISRASVPTGFMGFTGNKGGVAISFRFYETDICFVNCHFASGDGQTQRRNEDFQTIESRMAFTNGPSYSLKDYMWYTSPTSNNSIDTTRWWKINDHDIVFWFGDMNYRISQANEQVRKALKEMSTVPLHEKDQLRCEMKLNHVFSNYFEPAIEFHPTYKFDVHSDHYDSSEKNRTPSWTDRILYHTKRPKVRQNNVDELETIVPLDYSSARTIRFSDHRPVSGLYLVTIKHECDKQRLQRIREELIRQIDREENDLIPAIEVRPRAPAIVFENVRYFDRKMYSITIRNVGECYCRYSFRPPSLSREENSKKSKSTIDEPFFDCLTLIPNPCDGLEPHQEETIDICFQMKSQYIWLLGRQINEILILHVDNGADTFITLDISLDMGPFGLTFDQLSPTFYDSETKQCVYSREKNEHSFEMKNEPPALYLSLIETLKARSDLNIFHIFNNDIQDSLNLHPIRDQIYDHQYNFECFSTPEIFMILLHLLQSLPEPLISRDIQQQIFANQRQATPLPSGGSIVSHIPPEHHSNHANEMSKAVTIIIQQLKPKEKNFFFRFLSLIQNSWPTQEQTRRLHHSQSNILNAAVDILTLTILHDHAGRPQRNAFLLACLNEEKKTHLK